MFDKFRDECGVFGIFGHPEAANMTYLGLYALQHRGQESAGIAASDLPYIFDRFYRGANGRQRKNGGAGLGLAITKRIMELHGSEIGVESREGQGTCFTLRLACVAP